MTLLNSHWGPIRPINHSEITWIVCHLKPLKAAGPYGVLNIIQHLPWLVLKFIAKIFNRSLALNYFPTQWKGAKIIMLPKPSKNHVYPLNYRPISLVNSIGKFNEKNILKRLNFQLCEAISHQKQPIWFQKWTIDNVCIVKEHRVHYTWI
jgi:hypothetical protein